LGAVIDIDLITIILDKMAQFKAAQIETTLKISQLLGSINRGCHEIVVLI